MRAIPEIAKGMPATLSLMTTAPTAPTIPLTGTTRVSHPQGPTLVSVHESETRKDRYDPGEPLVWESDEQGAVDEAVLGLPASPTHRTTAEDQRLVSPVLPPWTLCGGLVMPYRLEPPLSWEGWDSTAESGKPTTELPLESPLSPEATGDDPLKATAERPAMVVCGGVQEHPYRTAPATLSWDD